MKKKINEPHGVSLYVHVPFCISKCPYCAFYSVRAGEGDVTEYLSSLDSEIALFRRKLGHLPNIRTLYIGGGTPTLLDQKYWTCLVSLLERRFRFDPGAEVTVEANPGTITQGHIDIWKKWRVTRVSLGVQSLNDDELNVLGRTHDSRQAENAMEKVLSSGFSLSADMLFGLPFQKLGNWMENLKKVISAGAEHVSIYQLTLEPGTPWGIRNPEGLTDGYPFYRWAQYFFEKRGLRQYEIASFAIPGKWCRHNVSYWQQRGVIGLGPSAWSYLGGVRTGNIPDIKEYFSRLKAGDSPVFFSECLEGMDLVSEAAILALRTRWGVRFGRFREKFGEESLSWLLKNLDELPPRLLRRNLVSASLSREGMRVGNAVWERLIP